MGRQIILCILLSALFFCAGCARRCSEDEALFHVFDVIERCLKGVSGSPREIELAVAKTECVVKDRIEEALRINSKGLFDEGEYGLTPAHRLILDYFYFLRCERGGIQGSSSKNSLYFDHSAVLRLVLVALDILRTDKKVYAYKHWWPAKNQLFNYLEEFGIDKTAMSVQEFIQAINAIEIVFPE